MSRLVVCNARIEGTSFDSVLELFAFFYAEAIDVHGAYVSSGFIDSHMHLLEYGQFLSQLNLFNVHSREALLARVEAAVKNETSEDSWIIGRGFNEEQFDVAELPSLEALNAVSGKHPVALTRACGHQMLVNSKAMAAAGIDGDTMIAGGTIDFKNGRLYENAINVVHDAEPKPDLNQVKEWLLKAMKQMNRYGVTACGSDDFMSTGADWKTVMDAYSQLSYQQRMTVRVSQQCEFESPESFASFLDEGYSTGIGDDFFQIGPLKLICDGSLGAHTAALCKPYKDKPKEKGILLYDDEEMLVLMIRNMQSTADKKELETFIDTASPYCIARYPSEDFLDRDRVTLYCDIVAHCAVPKTCFALLKGIRTNPDSPYVGGGFRFKSRTQYFLDHYVKSVGEVLTAMQDGPYKAKFLSGYREMVRQYEEDAEK